MMTRRLQVFIIIALIICLVIIINMVKKRALELKYVLAWIICDLVLVLLTLFPDLIGKLARFLGIFSPMNMVFFLGFLFSLIIIFSLTVALSRVTSRVRKLAQQIALYEEEGHTNEKSGHYHSGI